MDVISLGKAAQALNAIKDLSDNIIAPLAEGRFPTVDERLDWLEAQATKAIATNSLQLDLSQGNFFNTELSDGKLALKKVKEIITEPVGDKIPKMTSDTAPSGKVICSDQQTSAPGWNAFDKNPDTYWLIGGATNTHTIGYDFGTPIVISRYTITGKIYSLSNGWIPPEFFTFEGWDGAQWVVLDSQTVPLKDWQAQIKRVFDLPNQQAYTKYRIQTTKQMYVSISEIEMMEQNIQYEYATSGTWESPVIDLGDGWIDNKEIIQNSSLLQGPIATPKMTAVTSAAGSIIASSSYWGNSGLVDAFDQVLSDLGWTASSATNQWLGFKFTQPVVINEYRMTCTRSDQTSRCPKSWRFEASNDGSNWTVLDEQSNQTGWANLVWRNYKISNSKAFTQYRVYCYDNNGGGSYIVIGQLYLMVAKGELNLQIAASDDGVNFGSYQAVGGDVPQSRYIKFKATLASVGTDPNPIALDFNQSSPQNTFLLEDQTIADGQLKLKTSYVSGMTKEESADGGTIFSAPIDKALFKSIEKVSVS